MSRRQPQQPTPTAHNPGCVAGAQDRRRHRRPDLRLCAARSPGPALSPPRLRGTKCTAQSGPMRQRPQPCPAQECTSPIGATYPQPGTCTGIQMLPKLSQHWACQPISATNLPSFTDVPEVPIPVHLSNVEPHAGNSIPRKEGLASQGVKLIRPGRPDIRWLRPSARHRRRQFQRRQLRRPDTRADPATVVPAVPTVRGYTPQPPHREPRNGIRPRRIRRPSGGANGLAPCSRSKSSLPGREVLMTHAKTTSGAAKSAITTMQWVQ